MSSQNTKMDIETNIANFSPQMNELSEAELDVISGGGLIRDAARGFKKASISTKKYLVHSAKDFIKFIW